MTASNAMVREHALAERLVGPDKSVVTISHTKSATYRDVWIRYFKSCYFSHVFRVRYTNDLLGGGMRYSKSCYFSHAFRVRNAHDLLKGGGATPIRITFPCDLHASPHKAKYSISKRQ